MRISLSCLLGLSLAVSTMQGCAYLAKQHVATAEKKVSMYENLAPQVEDLKRGDPASTFEIATRMDEWRTRYRTSSRFPPQTRRQLAQRLDATLPRYLLNASKLTPNPELALRVLSFRPYGGHCMLDKDSTLLAAAREYADAIAVARNASFQGTYARAITVKGREQGFCAFATAPFSAGKNQKLTVRVGRQRTYVRCYLPAWWKNVGGEEARLLFGRNPGTGQRVAMPSRTATHVNFVLNPSVLGRRTSVEQMHLSFTLKIHDIGLQVGQHVVKVGSERGFTRIAGAGLLWEP